MKINAVEPSVAREASPLHKTRDESSGDSFETSLMDVLDSGDELPRESSAEEDEPESELVTQQRDEEVEEAEDTGERLLAAEATAKDVPPVLDDETTAPAPEPGAESIDELATQLATESTTDVPADVPTEGQAAASPSAIAGQALASPSATDSVSAAPSVAVEVPDAPRIEVERVEDPRVVEQRPEASEAQKVVEAQVPVEARPGDARPAAADPQNVAETAQLPNSPPVSADNHQSEQRSRGEGEQRELPRQEVASGRGGDAQAAGVRTVATGEVAVDPQALRDVAAASQAVNAQADPAALSAATQVGVTAAAPVVDISEPGVPASPARPMPPEAIPQHVEWLVARGGGSAKIELHPPELGKLSIQVTVRGTDVQVVLNVQSVAAQTVVAEYRDTLENGLTSKDLKLDQFEVRDWGNRDELANRDKPAARDRGASDRRGNGRGTAGQGIPNGIAGALMQPGRTGTPVASDDGVNLRV